ncbi:unnamed protein product [Linum trigynum]|uniref:Uncharacterized protein n=1 Tax=Linum trigynum TaxID=586398 RepID=A0AAV2CS09_9ROSI
MVNVALAWGIHAWDMGRVREHGMDGAYVEVIEMGEGVQLVVDKEEQESASAIVKGISGSRIQDIMVAAIDS